MESSVVYGNIYMITSPTGKKYIGQTKHPIAKRFAKHVARAKADDEKPQCMALNNAIRKYGVNKMKLRLLWSCPLEDLDFWEVFYIECEQTLAPKGYNLTRGGSHRKEVVSEKTKDLLSVARRQLNDYNLPRNVVEVNNSETQSYGFIVIGPGGWRQSFTSINMTMEEKYKRAMECYEAIQKGEEYVPRNKFKRGDDQFEIPMHVTRRGPNGFAVNKPGYTRKTFAHKGNTRKQNLDNAIAYLKTLE